MISFPAAGRAVLAGMRDAVRLVLGTRARRRVALVAGGVVVAGLVGVTASVLWLMWRLSEGPIRLEAIDTAIEAAVARELGDVTVDILGAELARESDGSTVIRLADVTIRDLSGQFLARAPQALVTTRLISAALGSVVPTRIELIGPHVTVHRSQEGDISFGFRPAPLPDAVGGVAGDAGDDGDAAPATTASADLPAAPTFSPLSMFSAAWGEAGFLGTVNRLLVSNARLTLFDEASQSVWDSYNAVLQVTRPGGGLAVYVDAPFTTDTGAWRFRTTIEQDDADSPLLIESQFDDIVPSEIAARIPALADLSSFDLPVSGHFKATVSPAGNVEAVGGDIRLGAGFLRRIPFLGVDIAPYLVDEGRIAAAYDRAENKIELQHLSMQIGSSRVALTGTIAPEFAETGAITAARFDLRSENLTFAAADVGGAPAVIERALASGRVLLDRSGVEVDTIIAEFPQGRITLGATAMFAPDEAVSLQGTVEDLPVGSLMQIWPRRVAAGARAWIGRHITEGSIGEGRIKVLLGPDELRAVDAGAAIADHAVDVEFTLAGVTAHYLDPLPPLRNAAGSAHLSGDRFVLTVDRAEATAPSGAPIAVTYGRFEIPTLVENDYGYIAGNVNVGISSSASAALEVLDLEPLEFSREIGIDVARVRGDSTIIFDLEIPLVEGISFQEIGLQAGATVSGLAIDDAFRRISLASQKLEIIATPREIDARGEVQLNGVPARAVWRVNFDEPGRRTNRLAIETEADGEALDRLGIDIEPFMTGAVPVTLEATGAGSQLDRIEVRADVGGAEINVPAFGWSKPAGEPAKLDFVVERLDNEQVRVREIRLDGDRITVEGAIRFDPDGSIYKLDISRMRLAPSNDLAINGVRRSDGVLQVQVRGKEFDAGELLRREIADERPREPDPEARPAEIEFAIDTVHGARGVALNEARGRIRLRSAKVAEIRLAGKFASGQALQVDYGVGGGAEPAVVNIEALDAGEFIRFLGLYSRAHGGTMTVRAKGPDARNLAGLVAAHNFNIKDEQLLVRIAETTSGFAARRARDVNFSRLNLEFERQGGAIEIKEALIAGPAVGASVRGRVDIAGETLGLSGTYIPNYGLNAAFGAIPLFGPILSGRSGEGVFGMTFGVEGAMSSPTITINPVSAIAPGLLRRFFEFRQR